MLQESSFYQSIKFRNPKLKSLRHDFYNEHNGVTINSTEPSGEHKIYKYYLLTLNFQETVSTDSLIKLY